MNCPNIEEKLKVFISSAMGDEVHTDSEETFKWLDFRETVQNELNKCPYIQAFTIENRTSTMRSSDFMVANVDSSDIVVLLIKNEFREGTEVEYTRCRETNKPMLVFFFGDDTAKDEVISLRKDLEKRDYCTYRKMNDFTNAEKIITNAVIQDVIFYYHYNHHYTPLSLIHI